MDQGKYSSAQMLSLNVNTHSPQTAIEQKGRKLIKPKKSVVCMDDMRHDFLL